MYSATLFYMFARFVFLYMDVCKKSALLQTHYNNIMPTGRMPLPRFLKFVGNDLDTILNISNAEWCSGITMMMSVIQESVK